MKTGTFTVAVNWGAWDEVGMAANLLPTAKPFPGPIRRLAHPLVERCLVDTDAQKIFATDFSIEKHWVLDEHRILGHAVIPGVTYFEMVRAALETQTNGKFVEFHNTLFIAPLRVRDGEIREVRLVLTRNAAGYDFSVRSHEGNKERTYCAGQVNLSEAEPLRQYNLAELRQRCNVKELILPAESREEDLGPRWHSVQRVYLGQNEALIELAIPAAFACDFEHFAFHPALQDRTAGIAKDFLAPKAHYLPFTYTRLTIKAKLQPKIYSYARFRPDSLDGETISFDIVLMDENGYGLVEIERFAQKRVNDPAEQIRALAGIGDAHPVEKETGRSSESNEFLTENLASQQEIHPAQGMEALRRLLAWRVMPQVIVSVRDLQASIHFTDVMVHERMLETQEKEGQLTAARPKYPRPNLGTPYAPPRNAIERQIAAVWEEVLGIEQVGIHDNFFELGADSLIGIQLVTRLSKELNVNIPAVSLFEGPTVSALSALIQRDEDTGPKFDDSRNRGAQRRERLQKLRDKK